mmetsp:Transcript_904/g.2169  ORF Transcript_904/g.2169 Transcript_904/m.2169 type:complete len:437 (+) Transcript_904:42-1352(+)
MGLLGSSVVSRLLVVVVACWSLLRLAAAVECPKPKESRSHEGRNRAKVDFMNGTPLELIMVWLDLDGHEKDVGYIGPADDQEQHTFIGHTFRAYTNSEVEGDARILVMEHLVSSEHEDITIGVCDGLVERVQAQNAESRNREFEALTHDQAAPCEPPGKSSLWSCVRFVPKEEYAARTSEFYGYATAEEAGDRHIGDEFDEGYTQHIHLMPRLTDGPGFLKMNFTKRLRDALLPWYEERKKDSLQRHEPIGGGYTNSQVYHFDKINLDNFREMQQKIILEMHRVLEWWTQQPLRHTSTFGIRVYRRHAMLINHVDRYDTHIASAVMQVGQSVDENGGWPLEVHSESGDAYEVYLQPGELVLYEGGKLKHGRPMRFRGEEFGNVFTHFAPLDWHGPGKSPGFVPHVAVLPHTKRGLRGGQKNAVLEYESQAMHVNDL